MKIVEIIVTIITAIGGFELIKYLFTYFSEKKKRQANDNKLEFEINYEIFQKQLDYLTNQLDIFKKDLDQKNQTIEKLTKQIRELEYTVYLLTIDKKNLLDNICYYTKCTVRKKEDK